MPTANTMLLASQKEHLMYNLLNGFKIFVKAILENEKLCNFWYLCNKIATFKRLSKTSSF